MKWLRSLTAGLPGCTEGTSYGTPAFFVNKKMFARIKEDGTTLVIRTEDREKWMKKKPAVYFITDHYQNYPEYMLVQLKKVRQKELQDLLVASWRTRATKALIGEYDNRKKK